MTDLTSIVLGSTVEASEETAEVVISKMSGNTTIFLDFHADWYEYILTYGRCGPCKILGPILIKAVKEDARGILLKIDVDASPKISAKYEISAMPTVLAIRDGKVVGKFVGAQPPPKVAEFIKEYAAKRV
jgi:thioredoxin 1